MGTNNFEQYQDRRQYSDITAVQSPVQDTSSATALSAIAGGIEGVGKSAFSLYDTYRRQEAKDQKLALEARDTEFSNRYNYAIDKMSFALESGEYTDLQAKTFLTSVKRELISMGADVDKLMATEAASLKTLSGKALAEGSKEKQLEDKEWETYIASDWALSSDATMEQHEKQLLRMHKSNARDLELATKKREAELGLIDKAGTKEEREYNKEVKKQTSIDEVNNKLDKFIHTFPNKLIGVAKQYQEEVGSLGEAQARANAEKAVQTLTTQATVAANQEASKVEGGVPAQMEVFNETVDLLKGQFLDNIGSTRLAAKITEVQKEQEVKTQFAVYNSSESIQVLKATNDMLTHAMVHLGNQALDAYKSINGMFVANAKRNPGDAPATEEVGSKAQKATFKTYSDAVKAYNNGAYEGDPASLDQQISGQLAYVAANLPKLSHSQSVEMLRDLESRDFGKFVKARGLTNQDIDNAKLAISGLKESISDSLLNTVRDHLPKAPKRESVREALPSLEKWEDIDLTLDNMDLVFESGMVMFKTTAGKLAREKAAELTRLVGGRLTTIVRADSNLSGESQESIFNKWKESLWVSEDSSTKGREEPQ